MTAIDREKVEIAIAVGRETAQETEIGLARETRQGPVRESVHETVNATGAGKGRDPEAVITDILGIIRMIGEAVIRASADTRLRFLATLGPLRARLHPSRRKLLLKVQLQSNHQ